MKKFILSLILLAGMPVFAQTAVVEALNDFSTQNPPKNLTVKLLSNVQLDNDLYLIKGDIVTGEVINVTDPKRLKRDASFSLLLKNYIDDKNNTIEFNKEHIANYTTKLNKKDIAKSVALGVGNHFVKGISTGYRAVEGAVKNEEGNRIKSSAKAVYDATPISYAEKGKDIEIKVNQTFYLNFKNPKRI